MNRLREKFAKLKSSEDKALIFYLMAGDPDIPTTLDIIKALDESGVDAIELGIPFSDPMADGPSIQAAAHRALGKGMTVRKCLDLVRSVREFSSIPIVLMTYFNPILHYGIDRFAKDAVSAGADATILTDLSPEEATEWVSASKRNDLGTVFLVAPTSTDARIQKAGEISTGFVYCVSRTGVTGAQSDTPADLPTLVNRVKSMVGAPVCVGFGISEPRHVEEITRYADGAVVGSALVNLITKHQGSEKLIGEVKKYALAMKIATRHTEKPPRT
jgi:tryptophan synthase alpha chain